MKNVLLLTLLILLQLVGFSQRKRPLWTINQPQAQLKHQQLFFDSLNNIYGLNSNNSIWKANRNTGIVEYSLPLTADSSIVGAQIFVDAGGNVYVVGTQYTRNAGRDVVVAKYSAAGTRLWYNSINGSLNADDVGAGIKVSTMGDVFITGNVNVNRTNADVITQKYSPQGTLIWSSQFDGTANLTDQVKDIVINQQGEVFIVGRTLDYLSVHPHYSNPVDSSYKSFFIKYDVNGNQVWNKKSPTRVHGTYVAPGLSGNFYRNDDLAYKIVLANNSIYVVTDYYSGSTTVQYPWVGFHTNEWDSKVSRYSLSGAKLSDLIISDPFCSSAHISQKVDDLIIDNNGEYYVKWRCTQSSAKFKIDKYSASRNRIFRKDYSDSWEDVELFVKDNLLHEFNATVSLSGWVPSLYYSQFDSLGNKVNSFTNTASTAWDVYELLIDNNNDVYVSTEFSKIYKYCNTNPFVKTISDTTICFGDSIQLTTASDGVSYSWNFTDSLQNDTLLSPLVSPLTTANYVITARYESGCSSKDTVRVEVASKKLDFTLCNEDSVIVGGEVYKESGIYLDTIVNSGSCDSIVIIEILKGKDSTYSISQNLCSGDSVLFGGTYITSAGNYEDTLQSLAGCDSIVNLTINLNSSYLYSDTLAICQGDSAFIFGLNRKQAGVYEDVFQSNTGCDSIYRTKLIVHSNYKDNITATVCGSYVWSYNGLTYTNSGFYSDTLQSVNGCDSIFTLNLTVSHESRDTATISSCSDFFWSQNGQAYNQTGFYSDTLLSSSSCDSIVSLELTINNESFTSNVITSCGSYFWPKNGISYTNSGLFRDTLQTVNGCDSILELDLTVSLLTSSTENVNLCGDQYVWTNSQVYTQSGTYYDTLVNAAGCDSLKTLNLSIHPTSSSSINVTACKNYSWAQNNTTYFSSGNYSDTLTNSLGCDSVVTLNLTINQTVQDTTTVSSCGSYAWGVSGSTYYSSGTYSHLVSQPTGCDSLLTLNLTLNPLPLVDAGPDLTICTGQSVVIGGSPTSTTTGSTYAWSNPTSLNDVTLSNPTATPTSTTNYTVSVTDPFGCINTDQSTVSVISPTTTLINQSACDSYNWQQTGLTYYSTGTYVDTLVAASGCDSVVSLNLTVNNSTIDTLRVNACNSYTWLRNNNTYFTSGTYYSILPKANGCDSIGMLDLTINQANSTSTSITSCGAYTWPQNNRTYYLSGNYADTMMNLLGCDSIIKLNLRVDSVDITVTQSGFDLTAFQQGATYQWFECTNGYMQITGATNRTYRATANGNYAVGLILNSCMDTSSCINVMGVGVKETETVTGFLIYPNPTPSFFTIKLTEETLGEDLQLIDLNGKVILLKTINELQQKVDVSGIAKGVYIVKVGSYVEKIIIQ